MAVLRVEGEIAQEDFDKKQQKPQPQQPLTPQSPNYQSPFRRHDDDDAW